MPGLMPDAAALASATALATRLVDSLVRLFKSTYVPSRESTRAELVAAECDFSGYPATGIEVAAWTAPVNDPDGGSAIFSGLLSYVFVNEVDPLDNVNNMVGGYWIETAAGALVRVATFDEPVEMAVVGDAIPLLVKLVEGEAL